jgi:hypothetical protein
VIAVVVGVRHRLTAGRALARWQGGAARGFPSGACAAAADVSEGRDEAPEDIDERHGQYHLIHAMRRRRIRGGAYGPR